MFSYCKFSQLPTPNFSLPRHRLIFFQMVLPRRLLVLSSTTSSLAWHPISTASIFTASKFCSPALSFSPVLATSATRSSSTVSDTAVSLPLLPRTCVGFPSCESQPKNIFRRCSLSSHQYILLRRVEYPSVNCPACSLVFLRYVCLFFSANSLKLIIGLQDVGLNG